ncbi:MAG: hypothetical protein WCS42_05740 [Verrucomicrobiota bacterium]
MEKIHQVRPANENKSNKNWFYREPEKPTTFEIVQIAALLATSLGNKEKTPPELVRQSMAYWDAVHEIQDAEKNIILNTVAQMRDRQHLFGPAKQTSRTIKLSHSITHEMWSQRYCGYADRYDLFLTLLCTEVPAEAFRKELFTGAEKSNKALLVGLIQQGGNDWSRPVRDLASISMWKLPANEQKSLFSAINTCDLNKADLWLKAHDRYGLCRVFLERLLNAIKAFNTNSWESANLPALLCRELIRLRQMNISEAKKRD